MQPIINYNPDVLTCLANLSNDEVFTPPSVVNQMLDQLPSELWSDRNATFLDPVSKTGVFLREIAVRLNKGLESQIPDKQERINHIYKNQLFGLAITELTSLLSRRGVYCSKTANGKYSICTNFDDEQGNIRYERMQHTWQNGRCTYCGANESEYNREDALETYAYQFIHTNEPEKFFNNMKFDVIIGNPPYQLSDGGAQQSATPIYHHFVQQAIKLNPRCFPGINIRGGVCYFLWDKEHNGQSKIFTHKKDQIVSEAVRPLLEDEAEHFIRYNEAIKILQKVKKYKESSFAPLVSARKPFGLATNDKGDTKQKDGDVKLYQNKGIGYLAKSKIVKNSTWIDKFKVIVPYSSPGDDSYPHLILSKPLISEPGSCCTETYLVIGPCKSKKECENIQSYLKTRFARFLILLLKPTQHVTQKTYTYLPVQDFSEPWSDEKLYKKYKLTKDEITFIESLIRPMD
jgi:site-specific DNA-methyltransferase (adenine-specific)